jgi:hypothetical protein
MDFGVNGLQGRYEGEVVSRTEPSYVEGCIVHKRLLVSNCLWKKTCVSSNFVEKYLK